MNSRKFESWVSFCHTGGQSRSEQITEWMSVGRGLGGEREARNISRHKTASGVILCRPWFTPVTLEKGEATERDETLMSCILLLSWKNIISSAWWVLRPCRPHPPHTQWAGVVHITAGGWTDLLHITQCTGWCGLAVFSPECVDIIQPHNSTWGHRARLQDALRRGAWILRVFWCGANPKVPISPYGITFNHVAAPRSIQTRNNTAGLLTPLLL